MKGKKMNPLNFLKTLMIFFIFLQIIFVGCVQVPHPQNKEEVWVFLTIRYETNNGYNFDYYFGTIDKNLYQKISENKVNQGFITLKNVRYWNNDDKIEIDRDDQDVGTRTYRIEDIREIKLKKGDPIFIYPDDDLSESTKIFVADSQKVFSDSLKLE
jgi:hypothetical protein